MAVGQLQEEESNERLCLAFTLLKPDFCRFGNHCFFPQSQETVEQAFLTNCLGRILLDIHRIHDVASKFR
jgi:hypothetical protein